MKKIKVLSGASDLEKKNRENFYKLFLNSPIDQNEILQNLGLYTTRMNLSRILFIHELYKMIINVHGIIIEFGVRWGQNLALFTNFRGIYEPYNYNRKVIGFDTFQGFIEIDKQDGERLSIEDYGVPENYVKYLSKVLAYHESESPIAHKTKYQLIKGDATKTFSNYLKSNPETIVSLAYFDFDIYKPTKVCLELLLDRVTKGSVIAFDELNCPEFPGETAAFMEVVGLKSYSIRRSPLNPLISYILID